MQTFECLRKLLISWDFHAQQNLEFVGMVCEKQKKKHPTSSSSVGRNVLLKREVRGEGPRLVEAGRKVTATQITARYNSGVQKSNL